jgi:hypothetical protein
MPLMISQVRDVLATRLTETTPAAASVAATPVPDAVATADAAVNAGLLQALPQSKLDALRSDAQPATPLAEATQSSPAVSAQNELDMNFKFRDLTLPYVAFSSAAPKALPPAVITTPAEKHVDLGQGLGAAPDRLELGGDRLGRFGKGGDIFGTGGGLGFKTPGGLIPKGPDIDPRIHLGDGDGSGKQPWDIGVKLPGGAGGVIPGGDPDNDPRAGGDGDGDGTGRQPGKFGPNGPRGGDTGWGFGGFHAFDIDDIMPYYRDPDLDPRAQDGNCGSTGCGTTNTPGCGATDCGTTNTPGCGTTSCGNTNSCGQTDSCGTTSCGNTNSCGTTSCGNTNSCGQTDSCGTTSCGGTNSCGPTGCGTTNSPDPYEWYSRSELLRQQLATELVVFKAKQSI